MVISYQKGNISYEEISGHISLYVYDYPRRKKHWNQDQCSDFFIFVHPRLKKMADNFIFSGSPFESYLSIALKNQMNSFLDKKREREIKEDLFCDMCASGSLEDEGSFYKTYDTFNYEIREPDTSYRAKSCLIRNKRKVFFIALSNPYSLDDEAIARLADYTGYSIDYIYNCLLAIKERIQLKREALMRMRNQKSSCFFQIMVIQKRIMDEPDPEKRIWLEEHIDRLRQKIDKLSKRIEAKAACLVSHQDLAHVLGISKGTVDSSFFYIKRKGNKRTVSSSSEDKLSLHLLQK